MKILHTGDWHLGNFNGPEVNGENARFLDICKCLDELAAQAIEEEPDFIIVAGDLFHQARVWSDRGLRESQTVIHYIRVLEKVAPVIIVRGTPNHDSEQQFKSLETAFKGDDSVHIFTEPGVLKVYGYHSGTAISVAALPGFDRGYFRAKNPGLDKEEENAVFTKMLEEIIIGLKAQCEPGTPSVLVGHYTITGANTESGQTALFAQYEPVVEPATLAAAGFDLTCFGHIHRPQQLEGCSDTFYCGAVSQLNFNDEGQERGFYLHSIHEVPVHEPGGQPPIPAHGHAFRRLPTREFKTIRLNDADIAAINDGRDVLIRYDVEGKIVRVLYDSTDEHNKALNKTMMEQRLYELGTFWVQEITPEKITVTVDKNSMDDDSSPEANLKAFLEEKGFEGARAARVIERAQPIIAEATEAHMTERRTGTFVPLEIEVHNYRNYREEKFSYEGIRFCTINGENGAGKSSLFMDAMCDALFEETREGDITGWISNDPEARSGSIKFTFAIGEATFRVTRTRMKSGKATLNIAELVDGEWADRSKEKFKDTQAEILNIIGMDSLTLKATGLIMQDQYGLFLTADKEARMTILGSILGLGAYADMEDIAADKLTETNREIRSTQERAADLSAALLDEEALEESIRAQESFIEKKGQEIKEKRERMSSIQLAVTALNEAEGRVVKLNGKISALEAKKAQLTAAITQQKGIIWTADTFIQQKPEIEAAVKETEELMEKEKASLAAKGEYDALMKQLDSDKATRLLEQQEVTSLKSKESEIVRTKLAPALEIINAATELEKAHEEYTKTVDELEAVKQRGEVWQEAQRKAADADAKYKLAKAEGLAAYGKVQTKLNDLNRRAMLLGETKCPHAEEVRCAFLKDAVEAKEAIPETEEELKKVAEEARTALDAAKAAFEEATAAIPSDYDPEQARALMARISSLSEQEKKYASLEVAKAEAKAANERLEDIENQTISHNTKIGVLDKVIAQQEARRSEMNEQIAEHEAVVGRLALLRSWTEKAKQLPVEEEKKATAEARIKELEAEDAALDLEKAELEKEREEERKKTDGGSTLRAEYDQKAAEIAEDEKAVNQANMYLGQYKASRERNEEQKAKIKALAEEVEAMSEKAADLDLLKKAFSQDGIPHNIVRSIIPIFEATATNILGQMSGGHMSVEFVMERTLKSNSKKEVTALDIVITDSATGRLPYMSRSGGERVKSALAVILALAEIKSTKAGVQLGFLFIDEPPFLDAKGVTAYCDALEAIQRRYSSLKVMAITHDPEMKSRFPQSVDVVKTPEGSKVIYG